MNIKSIKRTLGLIAGAVLLTVVAPAAQAQERANTALADQLDALATDRAQELNRAYYSYEQSLEEARQEAQRRNQPAYFSDRRKALRTDLEQRVLRIERGYEQRRADLLQSHTGQRWEGGEAENRFEQPVMSAAERRSKRTEMARLNTELAQAWSDFHEAADELRTRKSANPGWDGYEQAVSALEEEYQETITRIQERQRDLRFEMARDGTTPEPDAAASASGGAVQD